MDALMNNRSVAHNYQGRLSSLIRRGTGFTPAVAGMGNDSAPVRFGRAAQGPPGRVGGIWHASDFEYQKRTHQLSKAIPARSVGFAGNISCEEQGIL